MRQTERLCVEFSVWRACKGGREEESVKKGGRRVDLFYCHEASQSRGRMRSLSIPVGTEYIVYCRSFLYFQHLLNIT